jgi:selenophosphate synthetase-related protein
LLPQLAEAGLVGAGKDISMAGLLGTLVMLLETSGCGAELDLERVPAPAAALGQARRWLEAFPSFGFLLAVEPEHIGHIIDRFAALGVVAAPIAELTRARNLDITYAGETVRYWDLARENLMGFGNESNQHA